MRKLLALILLMTAALMAAAPAMAVGETVKVGTLLACIAEAGPIADRVASYLSCRHSGTVSTPA